MGQGRDTMISAELINAYERDGAVCVRGLVNEGWRARLAEDFENNLQNPGPLAKEYADREKSTRFHGDQFLWLRHEALKDYVLHGPAVDVARRMMGARKLNLFFDHLLIKEPGSVEPTPWHQDLPYWQLKGTQICSVWITLDPVTAASGGVQYVRGSHKWGKFYAPITFSQDPNVYHTVELEPMPENIAALCEPEDLLSWEMEPGDAIIHHALTIHGAPGNMSRTTRRRGYAVRYTGDDVVWDPRPYCAPVVHDPGIEPGAPLDCALFPEVAGTT